MKPPAYPTIEGYISAQPPDVAKALNRLQQLVEKTAPAAVPCISYGMPAYRYKGRMLLYFAAFTNHCSLFPGSKDVLTVFEKELKSFKTHNGTIQFTVSKPLPATLVQQIIRYRMQQNEVKVKTKAEKKV